MPGTVGCRTPAAAHARSTTERLTPVYPSRTIAAEGNARLNFIERLLGLSPDGGSGLLELLLLAIPICGLLIRLRTASSRRERRL
jgi:hypothetical protein